MPLFLALTAPWFILVSRRNPDFASFFFVHEHFQRFLTKEAQRVEPWWYFLAMLLVGTVPWLLALARAALAAWRESGLNSNFKPLKFLLLFSVVTLVFFSISSSKLATYILPMFPILAVFTGVGVARRPGFLSRATAVAAGLALFVAAGLLVYSRHRDGMIPAQAVAWAVAGAAAAMAAVVASWRWQEPETAGWRPLAVALSFVFVWQALLCEYTVIPAFAVGLRAGSGRRSKGESWNRPLQRRGVSSDDSTLSRPDADPRRLPGNGRARLRGSE